MYTHCVLLQGDKRDECGSYQGMQISVESISADQCSATSMFQITYCSSLSPFLFSRSYNVYLCSGFIIDVQYSVQRQPANYKYVCSNKHIYIKVIIQAYATGGLGKITININTEKSRLRRKPDSYGNKSKFLLNFTSSVPIAGIHIQNHMLHVSLFVTNAGLPTTNEATLRLYVYGIS